MCSKFEIPVQLSGRDLCSTTRHVTGVYHPSLFNCTCPINPIESPTTVYGCDCNSENGAIHFLLNTFYFVMGVVFIILFQFVYRCARYAYSEYRNYQRYKRRQDGNLIDVEEGQQEENEAKVEENSENIL